MTIFVIAEDGTKLMPTSNIKKVRKMLRAGRAVICKYKPFTIKLTYETTKYTQPIEFKEDAGYQNIGVSACSAKHEYISGTRVILKRNGKSVAINQIKPIRHTGGWLKTN